MMGCRERSKNRPQEQQEQEEHDQNSGFWKKRERGEEEVPGGGVPWAPGALWARPGAGPRQLAAWATGGPPWLAPGLFGSLPLWKFLI